MKEADAEEEEVKQDNDKLFINESLLIYNNDRVRM